MRETEEERSERLKLEESMRRIGETLREVMPAGVGFALIMFDFGNEGRCRT